jgi:hypothetical protein
MGDRRFSESLVRLREASDRSAAITRLSYEDLVLALAASSREREPYLANVLATELLNRSRRGRATMFSAGLGAAAGIMLLFFVLALLASHPQNFDDRLVLFVAFLALASGALGAWVAHSQLLPRFLDRRA